MASGKQRRSIIKARRTVRRAKAEALKLAPAPKPLPAGSAPVNEALLAPNDSYASAEGGAVPAGLPVGATPERTIARRTAYVCAPPRSHPRKRGPCSTFRRAPDFVYRGHYLDKPFTCAGCGKEEIWTATQQKWWYEVAKGFVYSIAKLCRNCRRQVQAQKNESRRVHLEGIARKKAGARITRK